MKQWLDTAGNESLKKYWGEPLPRGKDREVPSWKNNQHYWGGVF